MSPDYKSTINIITHKEQYKKFLSTLPPTHSQPTACTSHPPSTSASKKSSNRSFECSILHKLLHHLSSCELITHAGCVDFFSLFLLVTADAIDDLERGVGLISVPNSHGVVLVGKGGTDICMTIEDVVALRREAPLRSCRSTSAMCPGAHLGLPRRFADIAMRCSAACRASPETRMSSSRVPCPFITNTIETPKRNSKNTYNFKNIVFLVLCHRNNGISH